MAKNRRNQAPKRKAGMGNREMHAAMLELRRSSAAQPHRSGAVYVRPHRSQRVDTDY